MSGGSNILDRLVKERENILLAEMAAWFHDWQKCIPFWRKHGAELNPGNIASKLDAYRPPLPGSTNASLSLKEIVEQGRNPSQAKKSPDWRVRLLGICHDKAHFDKPEFQELGQQSDLISTVFGFETPPDVNIALEELVLATQHLTDRSQYRRHLKKAFIQAVGDTRRPINEVTLWDWGGASAGLWKAVASQIVLESLSEEPAQPYWRMLSIRFDGLQFLEQAPTISDLIGRHAALQAALDGVRYLLEIEYPLGNEVYRDENGSVFVVPALTGDDAEGNRLRGLVEGLILEHLRQSELGGELRPAIYITEADKQAAVLHKALEIPPPPVAPFQDSVACWWRVEPADICTVCGVRPQGWGAPNEYQKQKAQQRNVCYVCLQRRGRRSQIWAHARHKTTSEERSPWEQSIWLDEIADEYGRLALIVGKFDLSQWLNGKMIRTLLVVCDPSQNTYESKNPSFARIQRVWRTTQVFWQTVTSEDIPAVIQSKWDRIAIAIENGDELQQHLGDYHAYEAEINGRRLTVVWDSEAKVLLTAENILSWGENSQKLLDDLPDRLSLYEPGGYGQRRGFLCHAHIDKNRSQIFRDAYVPTMTLLTEPNAFMALIPASAALELATKIKQRYELEMSKVCNRLPLFIGTIFFDRRQPLFSALDAGRRLLKVSFSSKECEVIQNRACTQQNGDFLPSHLNHNHFQEWQEILLKTNDGERLCWRVSTVMGDGSTPDDWYPYVHVLRDQTGSAPKNREKMFEPPEQTGEYWVHVKNLDEGDTIMFTPSLFTWLHLDTSARRFEAGEKVQYMEELERITATWQKLKKLAANNELSESQLQAIVTLLATKESAWGRDSDAFRQLAEAVLHKEGLDDLAIEDLTSGRLVNTFDLYHRILKQKLS